MNSNAGVSQPILNKVERQAIVEEIEKKGRDMINEIQSQSKSCEEAMIIQEEAMMNEMKGESKSREEVIMNEIKEESKGHKEVMMNEIRALHFELAVVTLVCIGISLVAFLTLRRN